MDKDRMDRIDLPAAAADAKEKGVQGTEEAPKFTRRIGTKTYEVRVHFSKTSKETMQDKILRLIQNENFASGD